MAPPVASATVARAVAVNATRLPKYGGILPVFQALVHGESRLGSSIHVMTPEVDGGTVIAQSAFEVGPKMTVYDCYQRSYEDCGPLTVSALDLIEKKDGSSLDGVDFGVEVQGPPSYFGPPSSDDWRSFRRSGRRFC